MQNIKAILVIISLLFLISCSKDEGYGDSKLNLGSSNSYTPQPYSNEDTSSSIQINTSGTSTTSNSTEATSTEATSTEATSTEATSTEATSTEATSTEATSTEATSTEATNNTYNIIVTAQSSSNYILSGSDQNGGVSGNDPSISAKVGDTFIFNVNSPGHPFFLIIESNGGTDLNNLIDDVTNNGASTANNGNVSWTPTAPGTYYYICDYHPSMLGTITITE